MPQLSPEELVRWCQQPLPDDTRAFEHLLTQYKGYVFAIALRVMGNREDAEDQTQEVFVKVYTHIHTLRTPATFPAWLGRLTINTCINTRKRKHRVRVDSLPQWDTDDSDLRFATCALHGLPEATALTRELRECLEAVLLSLNDTERTILVLRDIEGSSYQEVSEHLQLSLGTVKMRIRRARLAFQQRLHQHYPEMA